MSTGDEEKKLLDEWIDEFMEQFEDHFREIAYEHLEKEMNTWPEDSPMERVIGVIQSVYECESLVLRAVTNQIDYFHGKFSKTAPTQ